MTFPRRAVHRNSTNRLYAIVQFFIHAAQCYTISSDEHQKALLQNRKANDIWPIHDLPIVSFQRLVSLLRILVDFFRFDKLNLFSNFGDGNA